MSEDHPNDPLHGVTLKAMVEALVERHGWEGLGQRIRIRCFEHDPSVNSSLVFLRRTGWAREKVEALFLDGLLRDQRAQRGARDRSQRGEQPGRP